MIDFVSVVLFVLDNRLLLLEQDDLLIINQLRFKG